MQDDDSYVPSTPNTILLTVQRQSLPNARPARTIVPCSLRLGGFWGYAGKPKYLKSHLALAFSPATLRAFTHLCAVFNLVTLGRRPNPCWGNSSWPERLGDSHLPWKFASPTWRTLKLHFDSHASASVTGTVPHQTRAEFKRLLFLLSCPSAVTRQPWTAYIAGRHLHIRKCIFVVMTCSFFFRKSVAVKQKFPTFHKPERTIYAYCLNK